MRPSILYRGALWRTALRGARTLPPNGLNWVAQSLSLAYYHLNRKRRRIVINNLRPAFAHDAEAEAASRRLFENFGRKLVDLWRFEAGCQIDDIVQAAESDWRPFLAARDQGRGVLLLTAHLGNWELGAPMLARRGIPLTVITLAEPEDHLTRTRQAARAKWGIETVVIGNDPFAPVEILRRLEAGQTVALLVDRPPPASAVPVRLFERDFSASISAAELARATGCALLPVCVPFEDGRYHIRMDNAIDYDRPALRSPESRRQLTQEIITRFEPWIKAHADQWYHFIPVWNE